jgi:hypothetical protein
VESLAERIARDGPLSELDAIGWAIRLSKRLGALHDLGVPHGSVSPACVFVAGPERSARAFLADVRRTAPVPAYFSPERVLGGDVSIADDTWALAATLYALLTGKAPFEGKTPDATRERILAASPARIATFDIDDDDLQVLLDQAFSREIRTRMIRVAALRRALEEWHPDRGVSELMAIDDEDSNEDDEDGMRTLLVPMHSLSDLKPGLPNGSQRGREARYAAMRKVVVADVVAPPSVITTPNSAVVPSLAGAREAVPTPNIRTDEERDDVRTVLRATDQEEDSDWASANLRTQVVMSPPTEGWKGPTVAASVSAASSLGGTLASPPGFMPHSLGDRLPSFPGVANMPVQPTEALPILEYGDLSRGPHRLVPVPHPDNLLHPSLSGRSAAIASRAERRVGFPALWLLVAVAVAVILAGGAALAVVRLLRVVDRL